MDEMPTKKKNIGAHVQDKNAIVIRIIPKTPSSSPMITDITLEC